MLHDVCIRYVAPHIECELKIFWRGKGEENFPMFHSNWCCTDTSLIAWISHVWQIQFHFSVKNCTVFNCFESPCFLSSCRQIHYRGNLLHKLQVYIGKVFSVVPEKAAAVIRRHKKRRVDIWCTEVHSCV